MTPEERDLIADLFARLKAVDPGPKDLEADAAIRDAIGRNPHASYLLVQTALVQEHALKGAEARIAELERQLADAQHAQPQPGGGGSFLGHLLGGSRSAPPPAPAGGPWGRRAEPAPPPQYYQPPAYQQPAYQPAYGQPGGGFLRSALSTAAGFAGGALLFQGIERMLGYGASPFGPSLGGWGGTAGYAPIEERETVVNNYYGDNAGSGPGPDITDASDPGDQQNYDDQSSGFDDGGGGGFDDNGGSVDV